MGRFDVKSLSERARGVLRVPDRVRRFALHSSPRAVNCACRFSERVPMECLCCGKRICFTCGGVVDLAYLSEYLNRRNSAFKGEFEFDDGLEKL